jgi:1,4-dihydroxy-2-naphthoate octaprenyltransferase
MNRIVKLCDYIFVLRPTLFFPVWTVYAAGYLAFHKFSAAAIKAAAPALDQTALSLLGILTLLMGSGYILNQLCDVETDRRNHKLFLIADRHLSPLAAWTEMILLGGFTLVAGFFYGTAIGVLLAIIFLLTGIFYNVAPFAWKGRPLLGLISNALGALLIFTAGWWSQHIEWQLPVRHALPYIFAVAAVYLYTTLLDLDGDAGTEKMTFGVRYGFSATTIVGCLLELGALISAWWLEDWVIFFPALIAAPFFILAAVKQRLSEVSRAIKLPIVFLALAICLHVWQYFLLLAFVFYFSKWYYRRRFGLNYPNFAAK